MARIFKIVFFPLGLFVFSILYFIFSVIQLLVLLCLPSQKIKSVYTQLDLKEENKRIESIRPFIQAGENILDIGAGSGRFGKKVSEALSVNVTGVDVCDYSDHSIPFYVYDGKKLPFSDQSFDTVFFAFVLHHVKDQEILLREACRVARKKIVIFEDTYEYFFEKYFTGWNDYHTNIFQGWIKFKKGFFKSSPSEMPMPLTFRSVQGWSHFFKKFPVKVLSSEVRKMGYKPLKKVTFYLEISL